MSLRDDLLVWIDLEMTGLDPHENKIIEIATIITDSELSIIAEGPNIVINQPEEELDKISKGYEEIRTMIDNQRINRVNFNM